MHTCDTARRGDLGGRLVDGDGVNLGVLRCPRCSTRLVSKKARLQDKGEDGGALVVPGAVESRHRWWWSVADHNDFDNVGMSHYHETARGRKRYPLCPECSLGPLGEQDASSAEVLLCCDLVCQEEFGLADDAIDFRAPDGFNMDLLKQMMSAGMGTVTFDVTFEEQRLGLLIQDVEGEAGAVEVGAFTEQDGALGPAEMCGKIQIGDRVARVNGVSCAGLDYAAVLDLIVGGPRPVTIAFERDGRGGGAGSSRVVHEEWEAPTAAAAASPPPQ